MAFLAASPIVVEQPDLEIDVVGLAEQQRREQRAEDADRHREHDRERDRPAFVERGEAQEDDEYRERIERGGLAARQTLLRGKSGPLVRVAGRQLLHQIVDLIHGGAGADAGGGFALEFDGG